MFNNSSYQKIQTATENHQKTLANEIEKSLSSDTGTYQKRIEEVGDWLNRVVRGYYNYYAIHDNLDTLGTFRYALGALWMKVVRRR
ncbi:MAG: hypothetical protein LBT47_08215, partial [Deltaproteobacteria bacterium]|nr:hypothetical protein [Deltaproteobacteria bacterium]